MALHGQKSLIYRTRRVIIRWLYEQLFYSWIQVDGSSRSRSITEEWTDKPAHQFQKQIEGQLFFNSTANAFKETIFDIPAGTWASAANLNTARQSCWCNCWNSNCSFSFCWNRPTRVTATENAMESWTNRQCYEHRKK